MRYGEVSNDLFMRRRMTPSNFWIDGVFDDSEIGNIANYCETLELNDAKIVTDEYVNQVRISKVAFIGKDDTTEWFYNKFNHVINRVNNNYYGFDLHGYESIQYTTYDKDGKFEWHTDLLYDENLGNTKNSDTRKLSLVMLLNTPGEDFTGGEFLINTGKEEDAITIAMKRGTIVSFPSFIPHKVAPVTSGVRKSLVIWVEGPKFR
jgi:PKHD-type hydroxylase